MRVIENRLSAKRFNAASTPFCYVTKKGAISALQQDVEAQAMVDHFAIAVTHVLMAIMLWKLLSRTDLDEETWMVPPAPHKSAVVQPPLPASEARANATGEAPHA
jgi:hypothetical protein